jgi:hypothetical protein
MECQSCDRNLVAVCCYIVIVQDHVWGIDRLVCRRATFLSPNLLLPLLACALFAYRERVMPGVRFTSYYDLD